MGLHEIIAQLFKKSDSAKKSSAQETGQYNLNHNCTIERYLQKDINKCIYFGPNTAIEHDSITWLGTYNKIGFMIEHEKHKAEGFAAGFLSETDVFDVNPANLSIGRSTKPSLEIKVPRVQTGTKQSSLIDLIFNNKKLYAYMSSPRLSGKPSILTFSTEAPTEEVYYKGKPMRVSFTKPAQYSE